MTKSVWIYADGPSHCVKVFASYDSAIEWLREHDPKGVTVEYPVEDEAVPTISPKRTDVQILVDAFLEARLIISDYLVPNMPQSAGTTVDKLTNVLTNDHVVAAIGRIEGRKRFGVIEMAKTREPFSSK